MYVYILNGVCLINEHEEQNLGGAKHLLDVKVVIDTIFYDDGRSSSCAMVIANGEPNGSVGI